MMECVHLGAFAPSISTSSLTATSVTVSWTQPPFSFTPVGYVVTLTRVMGSGQALCTTVEDSRTPVSTSATSLDFTDLEEFSTYAVTVTATIVEFGLSSAVIIA